MKRKLSFTVLLSTFSSLAMAAESTLDEVVVTATRSAQPVKQTISTATVITREQIAQSPQLTLPALLQSHAGVETGTSGGMGAQTGLFLRGMESDQVLVLLDGVRIGSATTGATAVQDLALDQIERIEVVRGNVSSLYGSEAIGGVIQIFTRQGQGQPAANVAASYGSHSTRRISGGYAGVSGNLNFSVQASHLDTDGVSAMDQSIYAAANPDEDGYENNSVSSNLKYWLNHQHGISLSLFQSDGEVEYDSGFAPTDVYRNEQTLQKVSVGLDSHWTEDWHSQLNISQGSDELQRINQTAFGNTHSILETRNRQINWKNTVTVRQNDTLLLGLEQLRQTVSSSGLAPTAYNQEQRKVNSLYAGYTGYQGNHQLQFNLRHDDYSDFGGETTGLLGYAYDIDAQWRVKGSYSTAFRAPTFNEAYAPAAWGANPDLRPEQARNAEIGIRYAIEKHQAEAVYFVSRTEDLIAYPAGAAVNIDEAANAGLEVSYQGQFASTRVRARLTAQDPVDRSNNDQALLRRAQFFGMLGVQRQWNQWRLGGEWHYSNTRTDAFFDPVTFAPDRKVLPSYHVFNLQAGYQWSPQLELQFNINNLTDEDNATAYGYQPRGRQLFVGIQYNP